MNGLDAYEWGYCKLCRTLVACAGGILQPHHYPPPEPSDGHDYGVIAKAKRLGTGTRCNEQGVKAIPIPAGGLIVECRLADDKAMKALQYCNTLPVNPNTGFHHPRGR